MGRDFAPSVVVLADGVGNVFEDVCADVSVRISATERNDEGCGALEIGGGCRPCAKGCCCKDVNCGGFGIRFSRAIPLPIQEATRQLSVVRVLGTKSCLNK